MQRGNLFLSICAGIFGAALLVQLVRDDAGSRIQARLRGQDQRVLYNNYLWQHDDDDDYFSNGNHTKYFSYNQNYRAQGKNSYLGGGSYVNGYNNNKYSKYSSSSSNNNNNGNGNSNNDDGTNNDAGQTSSSSGSDSSIKKSSAASSGAFGSLSPSQSAFLGIFIGLLLITMIACCLYGPTLWALFTDWLFNRKNAKVQHDFESMA